MDRRIIELYDEYTHTPLDRRVFMERLIRLTGGAAAAMAVLPLLESNRAAAAVIAEDDSRLKTETVSIPGPAGSISGYAVRPAESDARLPAVIVIHENRGLNAHIRDVARRVALAGYFAVAPDFLSPLGGTPQDEDEARALIGKLDREQTVQNAVAIAQWLRQHPGSTSRVGAVGFCWGGGLVGQLAVADPELSAAVVFYGMPPDPKSAARIKAPLLLHYAGLDERINAAVPAFRSALDQAGVRYTLHMYEGAHHAFHNDTSPARYDAEAAKLAWERTLEFFDQTLRNAKAS